MKLINKHTHKSDFSTAPSHKTSLLSLLAQAQTEQRELRFHDNTTRSFTLNLRPVLAGFWRQNRLGNGQDRAKIDQGAGTMIPSPTPQTLYQPNQVHPTPSEPTHGPGGPGRDKPTAVTTECKIPSSSY